MPEITQRSLHADIDSIRDSVVALSRHITEAILRATQVLLTNNLVEAQNVINDDDAIDRASQEIEERCRELLLLQQPMARDLRQILSAMRITIELERSGDLASNICKATQHATNPTLPSSIQTLIERMSEETVRLTRSSVNSFAESDSTLAASIDTMDDKLDKVHIAFVSAVLEASLDMQLAIQPAVQLTLIGRYYERIGDHAVNIGNKVRYMVDG